MKSLLSFVFSIASFVAFAQLDFKSAPFIDGYRTPNAIFKGDFDGNGTQDLFTPTGPHLNMYVSYTPNDGTFNFTKKNFSIAANQKQFAGAAVGDLNNDGKTDIVILTSNSTGSNLTVELSSGQDFASPIIINRDGSYGSIQVVDLDNDQNLDIIYMASGKSTFLKGDGSGNFLESTSIILPQPDDSLYDFEALDINNDAKIDFVFISKGIVSGLLQNEDHTFTKSQTHFDGGSNVAHDMVDISGDGLPDLVFTVLNPGQTLQYMINNGAGGFLNPGVILNDPQAAIYFAVDHIDYDNDGKQDLAVGTYPGPSGVFILHNLGNNTFENKSPNYLRQGTVNGVAFIDLDGTGAPELVADNSWQNMTLYQKIGDDYEYVKTDVIGAMLNSGKIYDLDNDGVDDIVGASESGAIAVWYGKGNVTYEEPIFYPYDHSVEMIDVADYDGDGYGDIAFTTERGYIYDAPQTGILMSDGARSYTANILGNFGVGTVYANDFNNDGKIDLGSISGLFKNNGDGTFDTKPVQKPANTTTTVTGDFNGDGFLDMAFRLADGTLFIGFNDQSPAIQGATQASGITIDHIQTVKLNNDLSDDLIGISKLYASPSVVKLLVGRGDGQFDVTDLSYPNFNIEHPTADDVDDDGFIDIIAHASNTEAVGIILIKGKNGGGYEEPRFFVVNQSDGVDNPFNLRDMNNDGRLDIVSYSVNGLAVSVFLNILITDPTIAASELTSTPSLTTATISLTRGNGNGRLITVRKDTDTDEAPVDGIIYNADPDIGNSDPIGNNYVVMSSDDTSVSITGLSEGTKYVINVYEYSKGTTVINYVTTPASISFTTLKKQVIMIDPVNDITFGEGNVTLLATSNAGETTISYTIVSGGGSIANNIYTPTSPGHVTINAIGNATDQYTEGTGEVTFCINPSKPTITSTGSPLLLTSSSDDNNSWYLNDELIPEAAEKTFTPVEDGIYTVVVTVDGCANTSDPTNDLILAVEDEMTKSFVISPNPATLSVTIGLPANYVDDSEPVFFSPAGKPLQLPVLHRQNMLEVNISDLQPGLYVIKLANVSLKMIKK